MKKIVTIGIALAVMLSILSGGVAAAELVADEEFEDLDPDDEILMTAEITEIDGEEASVEFVVSNETEEVFSETQTVDEIGDDAEHLDANHTVESSGNYTAEILGDETEINSTDFEVDSADDPFFGSPDAGDPVHWIVGIIAVVGVVWIIREVE